MTEASPPPPQLVIVLGFPRSGGTLLRRLLAGHPQISFPPEPWLTTACAKFLSEVPAEGPAIGVCAGLGFSGISEAEILGELRGLTLRLHGKIAGGKPVVIEKSGFDIFHLETLETLFAGHARFICLWRNPLDVIASTRDLVARMGMWPAELHRFVQAYPSETEAYAAAWAERAIALEGFVARNAAACLSYRYEDLVADPEPTLAALLAFLGLPEAAPDHAPLGIGLGDWKVYGRTEIDAASVNRWRKTLPREILGRALPTLAPIMERHGYKVPKIAPKPTTDAAIRRFSTLIKMQAGPSEGAP